MTGTFLFWHALSDFARLRRVIVWLLVALSFFGIGKLVLMASSQWTQDDVYPMLSGMLVFRILPLAAAIFSTAVLSQEIEQKTIVYLLTRPIPRWQLLLARTLAAVVVVFFISLVAAIMVSVSVYGGAGLTHEYLRRDIVALVVGSLAYGVFFVLISLFWNRAMIICLLFAFGWESSIPNMPGDIYYLSISSYLTAIAQRPTVVENQPFLGALANQLNINLISTTNAWIVMILLIGACTALGLWWFSTNEYLPREDAE